MNYKTDNLLVNEIINIINNFDILKHPFYQRWNNGELSKADLQEYAHQYYDNVKNFPRYLSGIHSNCNDIRTRQVILENLIDEEKGENNHPELWKRFAEGLLVERKKLDSSILSDGATKLHETFMNAVRKSTASGIGAVFAYEYPTPAVSESKSRWLSEHYDVKDERSLAFFKVHQESDEWHTKMLAELIENMNDKEILEAKQAAEDVSKSIWNLLDSMNYMSINKKYLNVPN